MNKSFKNLGLVLLLVLLVALAIRLALTALEAKSEPTANPEATIRKVEKDLKQATDKQAEAIRKASEADAAPPPPEE